jgi:hypothetical protein
MSDVGNYNDQFPDPCNLSWKNVFYTDNKFWPGGYQEAAQIALKAGFKFYLWQNSVYITDSSKQTYIIVENDSFVWDRGRIEKHYLGKKIAKMNRHNFENGKNIVDVSKISTSIQGSQLSSPIFYTIGCDEGEYAKECYRV